MGGPAVARCPRGSVLSKAVARWEETSLGWGELPVTGIFWAVLLGAQGCEMGTVAGPPPQGRSGAK